MKRSIVYTGMFSVMVSMLAMTNETVAAGTGNLSDAVTPSVVPVMPWISMPGGSSDVSAAASFSGITGTTTTTTTPSGAGTMTPSGSGTTSPSGSGTTSPSGEGATTPSVDTTAPEKSPEGVKQDSERMRGQTEQTQQAQDKASDDMMQQTERMRKVGSPRF